jgi:hypothetical protein
MHAVVRVQLDMVAQAADRLLTKPSTRLSKLRLGFLGRSGTGQGFGSCGPPFRGLSMLFGSRSARAHVDHDLAAAVLCDGRY